MSLVSRCGWVTFWADGCIIPDASLRIGIRPYAAVVSVVLISKRSSSIIYIPDMLQKRQTFSSFVSRQLRVGHDQS